MNDRVYAEKGLGAGCEKCILLHLNVPSAREMYDLMDILAVEKEETVASETAKAIDDRRKQQMRAAGMSEARPNRGDTGTSVFASVFGDGGIQAPHLGTIVEELLAHNYRIVDAKAITIEGIEGVDENDRGTKPKYRIRLTFRDNKEVAPEEILEEVEGELVALAPKYVGMHAHLWENEGTTTINLIGRDHKSRTVVEIRFDDEAKRWYAIPEVAFVREKKGHKDKRDR